MLLAQAGEHAADGLRQRQQLLLGHELVEQLRLMRHRAEPAADVELEAALRLAVLIAGDRDAADVVEVGQAAGVVAAAGERDLELAAEVLRVVVAEQEVGRARWRRA